MKVSTPSPSANPKGGQFLSSTWDYPEKGIGSTIVINSLSAARISSDASSTTADMWDQSKSRQQLDFSSLGLFGREKETDTLDACFEQSKTSKQLVLVSGPSGSGKSALVHHFVETKKKSDVIHASGKFSMNSASSLGEVIQACDSIASQLVRANEDLDGLSSDFTSELSDSDCELLVRLVPLIRSILYRGSETC